MKAKFTLIELEKYQPIEALSPLAIPYPYSIEFDKKEDKADRNILYAVHLGFYIHLQLPENLLYCQIMDSM